MAFLKKLFGSRKKEEKKVDEEVIEEQIEYKEEINEEPTQPRNFKYLDELIHSGVKEIFLDSDIVLGNGEESDYKEGIKLDVDDLVIDGNGYTIDANGKTRIFYCTSENITIKNIKLKNGYASSGGAIYNYDCVCNITDSTLENNQSQSMEYADGGGAIYNKKCKCHIFHSLLADNLANRGGGAIRNDVSELIITESIFKENTAQSGGAIDNNESKCCIMGSELLNNIAESGGAIKNYASEITISQTTFTKNMAQKYGGGAIDLLMGNCHITGSIINKNMAKHEGGAINNRNAKLGIHDSKLTENISESGGAIHNDGECDIIESIFNKNTAQHFGGAIDNYVNGNLIVTESRFNENLSQSGGAIRNWSNAKSDITKSNLIANIAKSSGGAIHNNGEFSINSSMLNENTSEEDGGAMVNDEGNFKIFSCEFSTNKSPINIILNKDSLQIDNTNFKKNQSEYIVLNDGGGANLGIFNGEFKENHIDESVLCINGKFCNIEKTIFEENISDDAVNIINRTELTLTNPKIKDGGKSILNQNYILIRKSPMEIVNKICGEGTVDIENEIIQQSENFDFGYLDKKIHESDTKEIILNHDITFEKYERYFYEGGIELDIDNLIIDGNGKTISGSGKSRIFIITGNNITLKNIVFEKGQSHKSYDNFLNNNGGAIMINHDINVTIENCEFINNTSEEDGGAIHNNGECNLSSSKLNGNVAIRDGGAICNSDGELNITKSTLNKNTAQKSAGAIYNDGECSLISSTLNENTANSGGGAILNEGKCDIAFSTFNENLAQKSGGGGIHNYYGRCSIADSMFLKNAAQQDGGAIHNFEGELTIAKSTFNHNTAQESGGAIINWGKLTICESMLNENAANRCGGAICLEYPEYESENCTFNDNKPDDVYEEKD